MALSVKHSLHQSHDKIRLMEVHDYVSNEIVREAKGADGAAFHGIWISGLTQTTFLGIPDTEIITPLQRASLITLKAGEAHGGARQLCAAFDADSGGPLHEIPELVDVLGSVGVGMIIIEDKEMSEPGKKVNSLAATSASQGQADMYDFAKTIRAFKAATRSKNTLVTARIESFTTRIVQQNEADERASVQRALQDALDRASLYRHAGADAIMIHSKSKSPEEVMTFLRQFRATDDQTPLVVVPTTYSSATEEALYEAGANVVIYANHLMRGKIQAGTKASDNFLATHPEVFRGHPDISACVTARNFGCLLPKLDEKADKSEAAQQYAAAVQSSASDCMKTVARCILDSKTAAGGDAYIITAKELLQINSHQVSFRLGPIDLSGSSADGSSSEEGDPVGKEKAEPYSIGGRSGLSNAVKEWVRRCMTRLNLTTGSS